MKPDKNRARGIGFYLLIGVIILAVIFYLTTPAEQKEYTYSEIEELFRQEQVKSFCLEGDELTLNQKLAALLVGELPLGCHSRSHIHAW